MIKLDCVREKLNRIPWFLDDNTTNVFDIKLHILIFVRKRTMFDIFRFGLFTIPDVYRQYFFSIT